MTPLEAFNRAIDQYGSQEAMAAALGLNQPKISRRLATSMNVEAEWVLKIERDTGISRHDLRPDIYPRPNHGANVSGQWDDEYGNPHPILDKDINDDLPANQSKNEVAA